MRVNTSSQPCGEMRSLCSRSSRLSFARDACCIAVSFRNVSQKDVLEHHNPQALNVLESSSLRTGLLRIAGFLCKSFSVHTTLILRFRPGESLTLVVRVTPMLLLLYADCPMCPDGNGGVIDMPESKSSGEVRCGDVRCDIGHVFCGWCLEPSHKGSSWYGHELKSTLPFACSCH